MGTGIALADEQGVDALSMRNNDDLLTLMVDAVAAEIDLPDPDAAPLVAVRTMVVSTNAALSGHPWAAPLMRRRRSRSPLQTQGALGPVRFGK